MVIDDRPLVTFALVAYNQEKFVGEAITGAFAQSYGPLEIILSDDCSTDDTFSIMREMAALYAGPHTIVLNRNATNLNIGNHINTINRLARGELVVAAAGDDISVPERVSELVGAWIDANRQPGLLHSACQVISEAGVVVKDLACPCLHALGSAEEAAAKNAFVIGATEAWDRSLFNSFGDLRGDLVHEDRALPFRALIGGRSVKYIERPLVQYRQGVGVSSAYAGSGARLNSDQRRVVLQRLRTDAQQKLDDLRKAPNARLEKIVMAVARRHDVSLEFERGMPGPAQLMGMVREVGVAHVARMAAKRAVNVWLERK